MQTTIKYLTPDSIGASHGLLILSKAMLALSKGTGASKGDFLSVHFLNNPMFQKQEREINGKW